MCVCVQVLLEVTAQLDRHQETLVAAAEKQEQPRGGFTNDSKGVKTLGVLPQTEALAAAANEITAMLAATALGSTLSKTDQALAVLSKLLDDPDSTVRASAAGALWPFRCAF